MGFFYSDQDIVKFKSNIIMLLNYFKIRILYKLVV